MTIDETYFCGSDAGGSDAGGSDAGGSEAGHAGTSGAGPSEEKRNISRKEDKLITKSISSGCRKLASILERGAFSLTSS